MVVEELTAKEIERWFEEFEKTVSELDRNDLVFKYGYLISIGNRMDSRKDNLIHQRKVNICHNEIFRRMEE